MSALGRYRWSQNSARLLGYLDFKFVHSASGMSLLQRGALLRELPCHALAAAPRPVCPPCSRRSLGLPCVGVGGGGRYSCPAHASSAALTRESCWLLAGLPPLLVFPWLGKPPLHVTIPSSAVDRVRTRADCLLFIKSNLR